MGREESIEACFALVEVDGEERDANACAEETKDHEESSGFRHGLVTQGVHVLGVKVFEALL